MLPLTRSRHRARFFGDASTLEFDFISASALDSRITFTRASSATRFNSSGVLETVGNDVARLDFNPVTLAPEGLLIEEQRTNLALTSGDILSGGTGGVVVADQITAPDGSLADFFREDTSNGEHYGGDRAVSVTAGTTYTWSFYAKLGSTGEARRACVRTGAQGPGIVIFDLEAGSSTAIVPVVSSGIRPAGNGWFRCWIVFIPTGTGVAVFRQQLAKGANTGYIGDNTSGLFFWGAQLEVGAFPTSYIPTTTTALTRSADVASVNTLTPWFNAAWGTLYTEVVASGLKTVGAQYHATIGTSGSNEIRNRFVNAFDAAQIHETTAGETFSYSVAANPNTLYKTALAYQANNSQAAINGTASATDASVTLPTGVSAMYVGMDTGSGSQLNGHIRRLAYYPRRLADAQLQTLTA